MIFDSFANILFPSVCIVCRGRIGRGVVCDACLADIPLREGFLCGECHAGVVWPTGTDTAAGGADTALLAQSPCHPDFPYLLGAAADYENKTVQSLVHHLKFRSIKGAAAPLADLIVHYLRETGNRSANLAAILRANSFTTIPIPLSPRRRRLRGYNQAELIAQRVADTLELPIVADALVRAKHTKPQSDIVDVAERRENIRGAYAVSDSATRAAARATIRDANILLIDDVSTTGATFLEASLALKAAGAAKIIAIAVAKT